MKLHEYTDINLRRKGLEEQLQIKLTNIGTYTIDEKTASSRHCENMIGAAQIPMGIAGPLGIRRNEGFDEYYIPLATTEGALVASVNRGCRVITESGGANVISEKIGITRAPVFRVKNIVEAKKLENWVIENFDRIKNIAESTSNHLKLIKIDFLSTGRNVWFRYFFDTEDAMGMNMATFAVDATISFIESLSGAKCIALSGNVCVDKKPNFLNFLGGRGYKIQADIEIDEKIVADILKTSVDDFIETAERKLHYGSIISGSIGSNAHYANILSAIFIATGQDAAQISECSMGITTAEKTKKGLYVSVFMPNMTVGTIGGGTQLATQKEALSIMGFLPEKDKNTGQRFAEVIGGAVLAGEISLLASLSAGSLARAHEKLARGK